MTNICILRPNCSEGYDKNLQNLRAIEPPIWLAILANYYKTDCLIDAEAYNYTIDETIEEIKKTNRKKIVIFSSGSHPSAHIQQLYIANIIKNKLSSIGFEVIIIDKLPVSPVKWGTPRWDLLPMDKYRCHNWHSWSNGSITQPYGVAYTSLSCPFKCSFCCIKTYYGTTFEQRLIEDIIVDFEELGKLGIINIKLMDELFTFNKNRVKLICEKIAELPYKFNIWVYARIDLVNRELLDVMKKAGINWVAYGIESGSDRIRQIEMKGSFNKDKIREIINLTKSNSINVLGNFMFGFQDDTYDTMQETLDFAKELNCEYVNMYATVAYPGSKLYNDLKAKGVKLPTNFLAYAQTSKEFKPLDGKYLTGKQILEFRDKAFEEYFTNPTYLNTIKEKFGDKVIQEIKSMTSIRLERNV